MIAEIITTTSIAGFLIVAYIKVRRTAKLRKKKLIDDRLLAQFRKELREMETHFRKGVN